MARKIYNNTYYDDSSPLSTLFQTGVFAGAVGAGIKYREQILDRVAPVTQQKLSPYLEKVMEGKSAIGSAQSRSTAMRNFNKRIIEEQAERLARVMDSRGARIISPKGNDVVAKSLNFGFGDLDEVVDASGAKIGRKVEEALKNVHGSASFQKFEGTVATFEVGGGGKVEVPFAKFNQSAGVFQTNVGGTINTAPQFAEVGLRSDSQVAMRMMDYNTYMAEALGDSDKRLILMNSGIGKKDADEARKLGNNATRKQAFFMNSVNQKINADTLSAADSQRVIAGIHKQAEFTNIHDLIAARKIGGNVAVDPWSRMQLAAKADLAGLDATHVTSAAVGRSGMYTPEGVTAYWDIPANVRASLKDSGRESLLSVGLLGGDVKYEEALEMAGQGRMQGLRVTGAADNLGFTGSNSQIAKGNMSIFDNPYLQAAERQKAEKAITFGLDSHNINVINKGMSSYGVLSDNRDKVRFNSIVEGGFVDGGGDKSAINMFTLLDNDMPSERISFQESIYANMNSRRHVQRNLQGMLTAKGGYVPNISATFDFMYKGQMQSRDYPLGRLATSPTLRRLMSQEGSSISISKSTYLGVNADGAKVTDMRDMKSLFADPDRLVTASDHLLVRGDNLKTTLASLDSDQIRLLAETEALPTKVNTANTTWRSVTGVHSEKVIDRKAGVAHMHNAQRRASMAAGRELAAETIVQSDMFDKILMKPGGKLEKGGSEMLQFLHNSIVGHALHYNKTAPFVLGEEAAATLSPLLASGSGNTIELSKLASEGNLMFKGALSSSPEELGKQISGLSGVLAAMRESVIAGKTQPINKIEASHIDGLRGQWDAFRSANTAATTKREARQGSWAMWNGWMASEQMTGAQGAGFQSMRISMKDIPSLIGQMPESLAELSINNRNDSAKMVTELSLMQQTWADPAERIDKKNLQLTKEAYEKAFNTEIPTLNRQQVIDQMLGGHDTRGIYSALKDNPEQAMRTLLSSERNPVGFMLEDGNTARYIPSGEFLGNAYALDESEITTQNFARRTLESLNEWSSSEGLVGPEFSKERRLGMQVAIMSDSLPGAGGFNNVTGLNISGALYSKHQDDVKFLQNMELDRGIATLGQLDDAGSKVEQMFGNTIVQHSADYENVIKQELSHYAQRGDAWTNMEADFGADNFFSRYADDIKGLDSSNRSVEKLTRKIVGDQIGLAKEAQDMMHLMAETQDSSLAGELEDVMSKMMHGVGVRHPNIYQGSYGLGVIMPDIHNSFYREGSDLHKVASFGKIHRINQTADVDGDAHTLRAIFGKKAREETWNRMYNAQKESAHWMARVKSSALDMPGSSNALFKLSDPEQATKLASELLDTRPAHSALGAFFTKAATGSMSVRAAQLKASVRAGLDETYAVGKQIASAENYFMTTISAITEQGTISSKHLESIIGKSSTMNSVSGLMGATFNSPEGMKAIKTAIKETNTVHPLIMMGWAGLKNTNDGAPTAMAEAVETALDIQSNAKRVSADKWFQMAETIYDLDDMDSAREYDKYLTKIKGQTMFFDTPEARAMGIEQGESFMGFLTRGISRGPQNFERGVLSTENLQEILKAFTKASDAGFAAEAVDEQLGIQMRAFMEAKKYTTGIAMESLTPEGVPGIATNLRRRMVGLDKLGSFIDSTLQGIGKHPGRVAGAIAGGLLSMRAYSIMTGDGAPESPEDLPSHGNPSMENRGNRMVESPRTLSSIPNYNSDSRLLTDNRTTHEEAMSYAGQQGYVNQKSNSVSVRSDGHNPYKSDMSLYE